MSELPALLGGAPAFSTRLPMVRPSLPSFDVLAPDIRQILDGGMLTKGPHLRSLEEAAAEALEVEHVVAVSSCTSGLMLAAQALELAGHEVLVPSFTFMATLSALVWAQATPVFVDVDPRDFLLSLDALEAAIGPKTRAIVAVHTFGNPAPLDALADLADRHQLRLLYDAAHGLGATYKGKALGSQGDAQVFSLSPTKLVIAGEGGLIATPHKALAETLRQAREYGMAPGYQCDFPGINARMPELSALLAHHSLKQLPHHAQNRRALVQPFAQRLQALPGLRLQRPTPQTAHAYKDLALVVQPPWSRDALQRALHAENIDTRLYFDPPTHLQRAYAHLPRADGLEHTEALSRSILCLPLWSHMEPSHIDRMATAIEKIWDHRDALCKGA